MDCIIIDGEELNAFRQKLRDIADRLKQQLQQTRAAVEEVAGGWDDNQFAMFKDGFEQDSGIIEPLCDTISEFESIELTKREKLVDKYFELL